MNKKIIQRCEALTFKDLYASEIEGLPGSCAAGSVLEMMSRLKFFNSKLIPTENKRIGSARFFRGVKAIKLNNTIATIHYRKHDYVSHVLIPSSYASPITLDDFIKAAYVLPKLGEEPLKFSAVALRRLQYYIYTEREYKRQ